MSPDRRKLEEAIEKFPSVRAVVVGDVMLDVFLWGTVNRISPEAPVPVVEIKQETYHLGGAANVAHNITALGGKVFLSGRVGEDQAGREVLKLLEEKGIDAGGIVTSSESITTVKTRIIAHSQQVVRFDKEVKTPLDDTSCKRIFDFLESAGDYDVFVVSDYAKGVITEPVMDRIKKLSLQRGRPVIVDPKVVNKRLYSEVTILTPNYAEAVLMSGLNQPDQRHDLSDVASRLITELRCRYLLITRGPEGMSLFRDSGEPVHIPACARKVFDVTGAGDTVVAVLALGIASGLTVEEAAYLANIAAGIVVGEVGTAVVEPKQLRMFLNDNENAVKP